jgi:hypothetical protein
MSQLTAPPPSPHNHLHSAHLLELRYISHVSFHILSINITIFFINDMFYANWFSILWSVAVED